MIDAHVHLWRIDRPECRWPGPDLPTLYRDHGPDDYWRAAAGTPVSRAILVQTQTDEADTRWLLGHAARDARIAGVVGWVDLHAADVGARIDALCALGPVVGIRPMVQDLCDDWYDDPRLDAGLAALAERALVLDALVRPRHLPALGRLALRHPELAIVVDHAAKPAIGGDTTRWAADMAALAACPRIACKLSGLVTEVAPDQPVAGVRPIMDDMMTLFGPERAIWGSDWPVVTLRAGYRAWLELAQGAVAAVDRPAVFGGNAARIYRLAGVPA